MHPGLLLLSLKGLIFYKVFNTQQEEEESSRSFAFGYFLLLQQVPCDEAKQLNDKSPGRERLLLVLTLPFFFLCTAGLHFACVCVRVCVCVYPVKYPS